MLVNKSWTHTYLRQKKAGKPPRYFSAPYIFVKAACKPTNSLLHNARKLLKPTSTNCKDYDELVDADDAKQAVIYNEKYADLFKLLGNETGIANFSYANVNRIYNVERELIHNMTEKQPEWVFKKWEEYDGKSTMEIIGELRRIRMMTKFNSPEKAMYMGSFLLNNFIENAQKVANGSMKNPDKMLLYSSHDGTVLGLMYAMNVANDLMVPYASALIMEIYKDGDEFFTELCGTPLPECKGSAKLITHVLSVALVMTIFM
ncbi:histidine acid phosphatase [Ancylostoma ceylanicum]|uniref:Histidine acid phosphatase n=1 Tax=Ancylostoma ceylanicum TaxID=53326 RepID=A0A0D6MAD6_9BILA|nr:histidine acid phosphatase [Ancylostoma ceylanicum]